MPVSVTLVAFFFLLAYTTSDLRTFRRSCIHVRKECSLEISVPLHVLTFMLKVHCHAIHCFYVDFFAVENGGEET